MSNKTIININGKGIGKCTAVKLSQDFSEGKAGVAYEKLTPLEELQVLQAFAQRDWRS